MSMQTVVTETDDKLLHITLNRPDKLNALSPTLLKELKQVLDAAAVNPEISVVVLKSTGPVFSPGYDISEENWIISQFPADYPDGVELQKDREDIHQLLDYWLDLWKFPKPIVTRVQGPCLSGAGELIAMSDIVIAGKAARFGHPAARDLGIPPTVFLWPLLIGMRKTKELLYTARLIDADEAVRYGLINEVVDDDALDERVLEIARDIARSPVNHLSLLKESANAWYENMGFEPSARRAADLDAVFHQSLTFREFFKTVKEKGMKVALKIRQERYGTSGKD
ncbi:MAG: enoyl-CoA hydratase/isomerase family protein [Parvibaculales bacterium]